MSKKIDTSRMNTISGAEWADLNGAGWADLGSDFKDPTPAPLTPAALTPAAPTEAPKTADKPAKRRYTRIMLNTRRNSTIQGRKTIRQSYDITIDLRDELTRVISDIEKTTGKRVNKSEVVRRALAREIALLRRGLKEENK